MSKKLYCCEIPDCGREVPIRTKIKNEESEFYGFMACSLHASMYAKKKEVKKYQLKPFTNKGKKARSEIRSGYSDFFKKHIDYIIENHCTCAECGDRLKGNVSEVAHILSKRHNPEIATEDDNVIYLCGLFSENRCHDHFDRSITHRADMDCYLETKRKVQSLKDKIINKTNEYLIYYGE